jgi:hypothetical protein
MRPLCPDEGREIGLSWLRSSQISSSNKAGPADREDGDHCRAQVWPFPWTLNHQGFAFDRWIQCWVRKSGCGMSDKSRGALADAIFDDDASLLGLMRKAVFYQRTAGSSSTKEPQKAPRESQCVQRLFTPERKCN